MPLDSCRLWSVFWYPASYGKGCWLQTLSCWISLIGLAASTTWWDQMSGLSYGLDVDLNLVVSFGTCGGVDANCYDRQGFSLLHLAAVFNKTEIAFTVMESGASLDCKNPQGKFHSLLNKF
ncbi:putative ankyrin repeat-containing domain-containing protein [Helianthus anomalus]